MRVFIDLRGASGATYRFRRWTDDQAHLPMAGNYVGVRQAEAEVEPEVLVVGVTDDLSRVRGSVARRSGKTQVEIYTRLNVSRAAREGEHADLAAAYSGARVETEA